MTWIMKGNLEPELQISYKLPLTLHVSPRERGSGRVRPRAIA